MKHVLEQKQACLPVAMPRDLEASECFESGADSLSISDEMLAYLGYDHQPTVPEPPDLARDAARLLTQLGIAS